jgi:hypothetical protein
VGSRHKHVFLVHYVWGGSGVVYATCITNNMIIASKWYKMLYAFACQVRGRPSFVAQPCS